MFLLIIYKIDVLNELKKHGYNTYKIKKEKIFNQTQMQKMRNGEKITFETLNKLCELTELQPGDILEYRKEIWQDHIRKTAIRLYTAIYCITVKKGKEHAKIKGHVYFTIQKIKNVKMKSVISAIVWLRKIVHNIKEKRKEKHLLKHHMKI